MTFRMTNVPANAKAAVAMTTTPWIPTWVGFHENKPFAPIEANNPVAKDAEDSADSVMSSSESS
jgi:hypothetical protein